MSEEGKVQSAQPQFGDKALLEHLDEVRGKPVIMPPDDTVTGYARGRADGYQAGVLSLRELERGLQVAAEEVQIERDLARQERDAARARIAELERALEAAAMSGDSVARHAYRRGAEAMREAAARAAMEWNLFLAGEIRALPLPQEARDE